MQFGGAIGPFQNQQAVIAKAKDLGNARSILFVGRIVAEGLRIIKLIDMIKKKRR